MTRRCYCGLLACDTCGLDGSRSRPDTRTGDRHRQPAVRLRAPEDSLAAWERAAWDAGLSLSEWCRQALDAAARAQG